MQRVQRLDSTHLQVPNYEADVVCMKQTLCIEQISYNLRAKVPGLAVLQQRPHRPIEAATGKYHCS